MDPLLVVVVWLVASVTAEPGLLADVQLHHAAHQGAHHEGLLADVHLHHAAHHGAHHGGLLADVHLHHLAHLAHHGALLADVHAHHIADVHHTAPLVEVDVQLPHHHVEKWVHVSAPHPVKHDQWVTDSAPHPVQKDQWATFSTPQHVKHDQWATVSATHPVEKDEYVSISAPHQVHHSTVNTKHLHGTVFVSKSPGSVSAEVHTSLEHPLFPLVVSHPSPHHRRVARQVKEDEVVFPEQDLTGTTPSEGFPVVDAILDHVDTTDTEPEELSESSEDFSEELSEYFEKPEEPDVFFPDSEELLTPNLPALPKVPEIKLPQLPKPQIFNIPQLRAPYRAYGLPPP